ncbi:MAG: Ppx/GppA phosphatase family protein [Bacillota bacterium]
MNYYAAIDVGTNSIRMLIAKTDGKEIVTERMLLQSTRLGEDLTKTGNLSFLAMERTVKALKEFQTYLAEYSPKSVSIIATSAVREAGNSDEFINMVKAETGFRLKVISGEEEARLSYLGASRGISTDKPIVLVDIGGGSTEIVYLKDSSLTGRSFPVGAVRCSEKGTTPTQVFDVLENTLEEVKKIGSFQLVTVGGTATTLAAVVKQLAVYDPKQVHGSKVTLHELTRVLFDLGSKDIKERKKVPGLQPERADIIIAGLIILWVIMTYLECEIVVVSEADILHGLVFDSYLNIN